MTVTSIKSGLAATQFALDFVVSQEPLRDSVIVQVEHTVLFCISKPAITRSPSEHFVCARTQLNVTMVILHVLLLALACM